MVTQPQTPAPAIIAAPALPPIETITARWYRRGPRRQRPIWIVIHCSAGGEGPTRAEAGAQRMAAGARKVSVHHWVDTDSIVQSVPVECEAWHAGQRANRWGEGIELCGRATQSRAQWLDALSLPMLALAARLVRVRADALEIPVRFAGPAELHARVTGITTHAAIAQAFPRDTKHWDPGPEFPLTEFLAAVRAA